MLSPSITRASSFFTKLELEQNIKKKSERETKKKILNYDFWCGDAWLWEISAL